MLLAHPAAHCSGVGCAHSADPDVRPLALPTRRRPRHRARPARGVPPVERRRGLQPVEPQHAHDGDALLG